MLHLALFKKSSALILTMVILTAVLTIALGSEIYVASQTKLVQATGYSAPAYYAAESGIECMLYKILILKKGRGRAKNDCNSISDLGNAKYEIRLGGGNLIISTGYYFKGTSQETKRAIQVQVQ